ncbi:hypothetical protein BWQ96_06453 [Gracilariopsis chorda]|uniref:Protein PET117, mitochondrial n=1 Tax=Gracilariopsis chorda TaxID=448386 RepID=A0A2V3IP32_9FLOR|nr:hypothetical protein BWQ96_06453 [Gracilariopsis chorda]|eukprot:PXF43832.1 hypothetical protein BWQ96_06453 [Gracilariopsis chorda]
MAVSRAFAVLAITCAATLGIIGYVHWDQKKQISRMQAGVLLDAERERHRREVLLKEQEAQQIDQAKQASSDQ